jgi:hypothetical protein
VLESLLSAGLCALIALLPANGHSDEGPRASNSFEFVDALNAGVRVQRSFTRRRGGRRVGVVHLYWSNETAATFSSHVELQCIALSPDEVWINSTVGRFDTNELGEIEPGFRGRLVLSLDLQNATLERMSCSVVGAR